jgi:hypothetical protein
VLAPARHRRYAEPSVLAVGSLSRVMGESGWAVDMNALGAYNRRGQAHFDRVLRSFNVFKRNAEELVLHVRRVEANAALSMRLAQASLTHGPAGDDSSREFWSVLVQRTMQRPDCRFAIPLRSLARTARRSPASSSFGGCGTTCRTRSSGLGRPGWTGSAVRRTGAAGRWQPRRCVRKKWTSAWGSLPDPWLTSRWCERMTLRVPNRG